MDKFSKASGSGTGQTPTHIIFSDESHWNEGRYRSISACSLRIDDLDKVEADLRGLLTSSGVKEFKWKEIGGARGRHAANKICDYVIDKVLKGEMRVDTVCWDIQDRRHNISGRDDVANLHRMYRFLFRNVLCERWPDNILWRICPDEHTAVDWAHIDSLLLWDREETKVLKDLFKADENADTLITQFSICEIVPALSNASPLIQVADLFAGMVCFSRNHYRDYLLVERKYNSQLDFFLSDKAANDISTPVEDKARVLDKFNKICKMNKLGVSLKTFSGLKTFEPKKRINFWWYEPCHPNDRAPIRQNSLKQ